MLKVVSPDEAANRILRGAVLPGSASSSLGCPDTMLDAIGARVRAEGHPPDLTMRARAKIAPP